VTSEEQAAEQAAATAGEASVEPSVEPAVEPSVETAAEPSGEGRPVEQAAEPAVEAAVAPEAPPIDGLLRNGLLAGIPPLALATDFGTPLYVYDLDLVGRRIDALGAVLPFGFRLAFAVKSNPALGVLAHVAGCCIGADIASGGELEAALRAGFAPVTIAMTGPGKRDEELAAAVAAGIGAVTVESPGELGRLDAIAARLRRRQPILLRLAVADDARVRARPPHRRRRRQVRHAAAGSQGSGRSGRGQVPEPRAARRARLRRVQPARREPARGPRGGARGGRQGSGREAGVPLRLVDAGGGLGIPYADGERPLDLALLGAAEELRAAGTRDPACARWRSCSSRAGSWSGPPARTWPGSWTSRARRGAGRDPRRRHQPPGPTRARAPGAAPGGPGAGRRLARPRPHRSPVRSAPASTSSRCGPSCRGRRSAISSPCWTRAPTASPSRCRSSCRTPPPPKSPSAAARLPDPAAHVPARASWTARSSRAGSAMPETKTARRHPLARRRFGDSLVAGSFQPDLALELPVDVGSCSRARSACRSRPRPASPAWSGRGMGVVDRQARAPSTAGTRFG
jgi:hypothetical protein